MRIIFLGTPEFAVESLRTLVEADCEIVAVVTAPDKPVGRGQQLGTSPVKDYAVAQGLPVLQPEKLKNPEFLEHLRSFRADLQIIVAFRMLPEGVWSMPPRGTFNLHASLLPDYRGAAPINWAVINGETQTGVTTFFLQHEIDTGPLIFQETEPIYPDDTAGTLYGRLMRRGAALVLRTVRAIEAGTAPQVPQPTIAVPKHAPKLFRETSEIDWNQPAERLRNFVRGLAPYPAAWTTLNGKTLKIFKVVKAEGESSVPLPTSDVSSDGKTYLRFRCADGWVEVLDLQLEGKKRMGVEEFLRGNRV